MNHSSCPVLVYLFPVHLWQILHLDSLQNIIKSSPNIVECTVTEFVEFIDTHQFVLLVFILIYKASRIWSKAFFNSELCNSNDSVPGVDITSRFPVDNKSIELLTLLTLVSDFS
ncbi:hypothetical protein Tco_0571080 [Tanacetum coccineum]